MVPVFAAGVSLFGASTGATQTLTASSQIGSAIGATNGVAPVVVGTVSGLPAGTTAGTTPFGDLLVESIGQVDQLERQARSSVEGLIAGKGVDVHEAMIATEKAEMGFELVLSVRNKALAAYQQVMGMQF